MSKLLFSIKVNGNLSWKGPKKDKNTINVIQTTVHYMLKPHIALCRKQTEI